MKKIVTLTQYGHIAVGENYYILLRPTKFEPEHYKITENDISFYVAWLAEDGLIFNPHILTICGEGFHVDYEETPKQIDVTVFEKDEEVVFDNITSDFRPIDLIVEQDAQN